MKRSWREWNKERAERAIDDYIAARPIRVFDRHGRQIGERVEVTCEGCGHWSTVVVPSGRAPRFRCSECGAMARPIHEDA